MATYRANVGLNYPPDRRVEAGETVSDLPSKSIKWLREQGLVDLVSGTDPVIVAEPEPEPVAPADAPVEED